MGERDPHAFDPAPADMPGGEGEGTGPGAPDAGERPPRRRRRWLRWGFTAFAALLVALVLWLVVTAPLGRSLEPLEEPAILFVSAEGEAIARRGAIKDEPVDVTRLPAHVTNAFIAIEDRRFYAHWGVDPRGIGRALIANAQAGGVRQGGSTITQQLAKTAFLDGERTLTRKAREAVIAFWLEGWLTKDEILSRYLSSIYFGDGVYGLRAAARHYFDRAPEKLTLAESAMLAGMVKAPSRLAPTRDLAGAQERSRLVLQAMAEMGSLAPAEASATPPARLRGQRARLPTGTYFADWVTPRARAAIRPGYGITRVPTTLDADLQRLAVRATINANLGDRQVGLVAMRPTGEVVALIGGRSYKKSPFNRATQARRQPGSAFKLPVYLAALRAGWRPDDLIDDAPITVDGWSPQNADGRYRGAITLREAFARSSNAATVRLAQEVGREAVVRAARDLGITAEIPAGPSYALGTGGVPLIEMTAAYAAIASGQAPVRVTGLAAEAGSRAARPLAPQREWVPMLELLYAAANEGTGRRAALRVPTFGKTGTSQDNRDAIFIGFAGNLVVGVWVGHDDDRSLGNVSGGTLPAAIFKDFMRGALRVDGTQGPRLPARFGPRRGLPARERDGGGERGDNRELLRLITREIEDFFERL
ncbi:transglycosylase domain-containing protein [Sphingomicrobium astaxanthinifaciens]|uniref:transglycosylase domain-containing protein n=1 Tax=Sphingomicrobium astaxanthinifaciens TaxID=1227949 RepID=UPI001FCAF8F7|nr:transglycosylase domain-containing protein [Sphingomicrobium astaxanthinifaciens]MCJ7421834.1 transglycosylase domain-containing protein [Sphingomicrobium astaxanthinifaciens]